MRVLKSPFGRGGSSLLIEYWSAYREEEEIRSELEVKLVPLLSPNISFFFYMLQSIALVLRCKCKWVHDFCAIFRNALRQEVFFC